MADLTPDDFIDDWDWEDEEERLRSAIDADLRAAIRIGILAAIVFWLLSHEGDVAPDMPTIETAAADWIERYHFDLVRDLNDTTRKQLQDALALYLRTPGMTLDQLRDLLLQGAGSIPDLQVRGRVLSAAERIEMIVTTEINRAYNEGLLLAMRRLGVQMREPHTKPPLHPRCRCGLQPFWHNDGTLHFLFITQADERVCNQCGPLHRQDVSV